MDPTLAEQMMAAGELPNFARLAAMGSYDRLATVAPPQSPVVWSSIASGMNPGEHGVFDFIHRNPATYLPSLSLFRLEKGRYLNPVRATTFWERLAGCSIPATLLKWPMGFPPREFAGSLLAGLGVPDVRGMLGVYTLFTSIPEALPADAKGRIVPVVARSGRIATEIAGPFAASLTGRKEVAQPLDIIIEGDSAHCRVGRQTFTLREGEWSGWIAIPFDVGFFKSVIGLCRFHLKHLAPEFVLYMTPVNVSYNSAEFPVSHPPGYAGELNLAIGHYATLGMAEDTNALNDGVLDEDEFLSICYNVMDERESLFFHELSRFKEGLLACVFDTTDRIQHMFWRMLDDSHPMYEGELAERYADVIAGSYRRMDNVIGTIVERMPDACLLVCSDHGFGSFRRTVHLNTWLVQNGFMFLKPGANSCEGLFETVDWARTTAYAVGLTSLYLNVRGREKHGIVPEEEVTGMKQTLAERLTVLADDGQPVVHAVRDARLLYHGKEQAVGPDLVVGFGTGYRASWQTAVGGVPEGPVIEDNLKKWSGDHCCDAGLVPGIFFSSQAGLLRNREVTGIAEVIEHYFQ
jgi:predicted AlkP superfamily phosphohydrolase/phosphomutase